MKTIEKVNTKRVYITPAIEMISLDNVISLVLASDPPVGPGEGKNNSLPEYFNNNPFINKA